MKKYLVVLDSKTKEAMPYKIDADHLIDHLWSVYKTKAVTEMPAAPVRSDIQKIKYPQYEDSSEDALVAPFVQQDLPIAKPEFQISLPKLSDEKLREFINETMKISNSSNVLEIRKYDDRYFQLIPKEKLAPRRIDLFDEFLRSTPYFFNQK